MRSHRITVRDSQRTSQDGDHYDTELSTGLAYRTQRLCVSACFNTPTQTLYVCRFQQPQQLRKVASTWVGLWRFRSPRVSRCRY